MSTKRITRIALIASIYFALSMALQFMSFGAIQVRVAEALVIAAIISIDGIYGITFGCLITNAIGVALGVNGFGVLDIVFGTLFTLIASLLAYNFKNIKTGKYEIPLLSLMMPVLINAIGLPFVFAFAFHQGLYLSVYTFEFITVFIGQFVSCVIIGGMLFNKFSVQLETIFNR